MNLKSSYLHLLGDTLSSVGVIIGGILIYFFNVYWVDPLLTVLISLYVLKGSYEIIKGAIQILMQGVPKNLDLENIAQRLQEIDGVENVHHAHIWSLDENNIIFDAHVNIKDMLVSETDAIQNRIEHEMGRFGINHVTIQFEYNGCEGSDLIDKTSCQRKI
jgi:cobalt-zinc-cadmium efflux system protein